MCVWTWLLLLNIGTWLAAPATYSAEASVPKESSPDPVTTTITSRTMTVSNQENKAIFDGSVVLTRGPLVVYSDHMVVSFHSGRNGAAESAPADAANPKVLPGTKKKDPPGRAAAPTVSDRSIRMVEATGRVRIEKEDGRATCQKALYYEEEKKIVLTGEPVAWQKGTRVSGKRITMFLEEDRSVVEGNSQVTIEGEGGGKR